MALARDHKWLLFFVFYAIVANLPYWAASHWLGLLSNGPLGLEYFAVGILTLYVARWFTAVLLPLAIAVDITGGVCRSYSLSPSELLANFGVVTQIPIRREMEAATILVVALLLTVSAATCKQLRLQGHNRVQAAGSLAGAAVLLLAAHCAVLFAATGHLPNALRLTAPFDGLERNYRSKPRLARFSTLALIENQLGDAWQLSIRKNHAVSFGASPSAAATGLREVDAIVDGPREQKPNVVLILVESWGLANDALIRGALTQPYSDPALQARYRVLQGTVPFFGPTLFGEGRELCGSHIGPHLLDASKTELQGCLPARLAGLGYQTLAAHGMYGVMFERRKWYVTAGFDDLWFKRRFIAEHLPECDGAFAGTCDDAIGDWIGKSLTEPSPYPRFVYWVTLNSHLPVPIPAPVSFPDGCAWKPRLADQQPFCSWYQLIANVHRTTVRMAMGNLARPTVFIIVGDHAPPFQTHELRDQFSSQYVPYLVLIPQRASGER